MGIIRCLDSLLLVLACPAPPSGIKLCNQCPFGSSKPIVPDSDFGIRLQNKLANEDVKVERSTKWGCASSFRPRIHDRCDKNRIWIRYDGRGHHRAPAHRYCRRHAAALTRNKLEQKTKTLVHRRSSSIKLDKAIDEDKGPSCCSWLYSNHQSGLLLSGRPSHGSGRPLQPRGSI